MSYTISMDKAGRIVIPKEVRERLGADESTRFDLEIVLDRIELKPQGSSKPEAKVYKKDGMWMVSTGGEPFDAMKSIQAMREERMEAVHSELLEEK